MSVPRAHGLERQDVANEAQRVAPPLARRHDVLDAIGEHQAAHAIVVANRRHRQHRRQLGRDFALEAASRAEPLGARHVDGEHHRQLALLDVALHVRPLHARRHVPVDAPHFVAGLVLAHLGELHSLPLEHRAVFAGEQRVHQAARAQLEQLDLTQDFRRHCGRAGCVATAVGRGCRRGGRERVQAVSCDETGRTPRVSSSFHVPRPTAHSSRRLDLRQHPLHDLIARHLFGLRLVRREHAMAQHVGCDRLHVVRRDERPAAQERVRARCLRQRDRRARTRAELDQRREIGQTRPLAGSRVASTMSTM